MNLLERIQSLPAPWVCVLVAAICFGEQFVISSALLPGSLLVVALGSALAQDLISPWVVLSVWAGNYLGDCASFVLGRTFGHRFRVG